MKYPPVHDKNARVCSEHFYENNFVSAILPGFGPTRPTLKPKVVPTKFCKRRKTSEARIARAEHRDIIKELATTSFLNIPSASTSSDVEAVGSHVLKPTTQDIGIQCG